MFIYSLGYQGIEMFKDCFNVFISYSWNFLPKFNFICRSFMNSLTENLENDLSSLYQFFDVLFVFWETEIMMG